MRREKYVSPIKSSIFSGTIDEFRTYSAEIYTASQNAPHPVREVVPGDTDPHPTTDPGVFLIADDLAGQIVFARPTGNGPTLSIVHEDRPALADDLVEPAPWSASETAVVRSPSGPALLLMKVTGYRKDEVNLVGLKAPSKTRRVVPGSMSDYAWLRYAGTAYAPFGLQEPAANAGFVARPTGIFMTYYVDDDPIDHPSASVRLTPSVPPGWKPSEEPRAVLAANDNYFVIETPKASTHPGYFDGDDWGPTQAYSLDRRSGKWRSFTLQSPAAQPLTRIFGDWLSTAVTVPGGQDPDSDNLAPRPGQDNEVREMGDCAASKFRPVMPDPVRAFRGNGFFTLTGAMQFTNLADGRDFTVHTGQEDSEVIAIDNPSQTVIYRVNDEIYSARIEGSKLGPASLIMKGCDVQNIHWAFWSAR